MKNIFVTANYDVKVMYAHDGHTEPGDYNQLTLKCIDSFMRNLVDLDEVVILTGKVHSYHELFRDIYFGIRSIWMGKEAANIIWTDSDNLCLKPLDIFDRWDKFSMFFSANEYKDCFTYNSSLVLTKNLIPWMMSNLRYYPAEMDQKLWEIGDDLAYSWIEEWGYECIIYNKMFHSQGITDFKPYHIPAWNVQCEGPVGMINPEIVRDSTIIHCQSTRGTKEAIEKMERALRFQREG